MLTVYFGSGGVKSGRRMNRFFTQRHGKCFISKTLLLSLNSQVSSIANVRWYPKDNNTASKVTKFPPPGVVGSSRY